MLFVSVLRSDAGSPACAAVRICELPIEPAKPGEVSLRDASSGTTTSPFGVSRRKLLMLPSRSSNPGRRS